MPGTEILNIPTINCKTIATQETDRVTKCSSNTANTQGAGCEQHYTNMRQEASRPGRCYTNINSNSKLKSNSANKPMVNNNEINYFLANPSQDNDKRPSAEITQLLQRDSEDVFSGIGCFDGMFSLQVKLDSKPYQAHLRHAAYVLQKPFKEELE